MSGRPQHLRDLDSGDYLDRETYPLLAQQMAQVLRLLGAPPNARLVGITLALSFANRVDDPDWPGGSIYVGIKPRLVRETGLADSTIRDAIRWLEDRGLLVRTGRKRGRAIEREVGWSVLLDRRRETAPKDEARATNTEGADRSGEGQEGAGLRWASAPTPDPRPRTTDPTACGSSDVDDTRDVEAPPAFVAREANENDEQRIGEEKKQVAPRPPSSVPQNEDRRCREARALYRDGHLSEKQHAHVLHLVAAQRYARAEDVLRAARPSTPVAP